MHEEAYGKENASVRCHKRFCDGHASVSDYPHCRLEIFFDAQGLVHYKFIPEGNTIKKEMYIKILCCFRDAMRGNVQQNGHKTSCIFLTMTHLHIGC
jgi:hypothetical protein